MALPQGPKRPEKVEAGRVVNVDGLGGHRAALFGQLVKGLQTPDFEIRKLPQNTIDDGQQRRRKLDDKVDALLHLVGGREFDQRVLAVHLEQHLLHGGQGHRDEHQRRQVRPPHGKRLPVGLWVKRLRHLLLDGIRRLAQPARGNVGPLNVAQVGAYRLLDDDLDDLAAAVGLVLAHVPQLLGPVQLGRTAQRKGARETALDRGGRRQEVSTAHLRVGSESLAQAAGQVAPRLLVLQFSDKGVVV